MLISSLTLLFQSWMYCLFFLRDRAETDEFYPTNNISEVEFKPRVSNFKMIYHHKWEKMEKAYEFKPHL